MKYLLQNNLTKEDLIAKIVIFIKQSSIKNFDFGESLGKEGNWASLSMFVTGLYDYTSALNLKQIWERDQENIKTLVINAFQRNLTIRFSIYEWQVLSKSYVRLTSENRRKFDSGFVRELNKRLISNEEFQLGCTLAFSNNWFSARQTNHIWKGALFCSVCKSKFSGVIVKDQNSEEHVLNLTYDNNITFHETHSNYQLRGKERNEIQLKLQSKNLDLLLAENRDSFQFSNKLTEKRLKQKLAKAKSEAKLIDRISNKILTDTEAVKRIYDAEYPALENKVQGFIQEISSHPFGFYVVSQMQINIWKIVQKIKPFWYFDAAGFFLKNIEEQNSPLLYSIVIHDHTNSIILPLAEFHTTKHTSANIQSYLYKIHITLKSNTTTNILPKIIIVDFSWACINAILAEFMNITMTNYLMDCFNYLRESNDKMKQFPKIYLCSVHILKKIARDFDKAHKNKKKDEVQSIRKVFLYCFSLLQNSISMEDFESHLSNIYYIFQSEFVTVKCMEAFKMIRTAINTRFLNRDKNIFHETHLDNDAYDNSINKIKKQNEEHFKGETPDSIKQNSPFLHYFNEKIKTYDLNVKQDNLSDKNRKKNFFYSPCLFKKIDNVLYLMPLWSGVMITEDLEQIKSKVNSRESNNFVENWFSHFRNNLLRISKKLRKEDRLMPSQLVAIELKYIRKKYQEIYENNFINKAISSSEKNEIDLKKNAKNKKDVKELTEDWRYGKTKNSKTKGSTYKNPKNIFKNKIGEDIEHQINDLIDNDFDILFDSEKLFQSNTLNEITNLDILSNMTLVNGGSLKIGETIHKFINTCSIDHFLFVCHLLFKKSEKCLEFHSKDNSFFDFIKETSYFLEKNDWNKARYAWLNFNHFLRDRISINQNSTVIHDYFLSEYESFYSFYMCKQEYSWKYSCSNPSCTKKFGSLYSSSYFNIRLKDGKFICSNKIQESNYCATEPINSESENCIILESNSKCNGILKDSEKCFKKPVLLVVFVDKSVDDLANIPQMINVFNINYKLIGVSVFINKSKHIYFKLFDGDKFYTFDNLNDYDLKNTSTEINGGEMNYAFYEILIQNTG